MTDNLTIEIFKTTVRLHSDAALIVGILEKRIPGAQINFDLADIDCVLRIAHHEIPYYLIEETLQSMGHKIEIIP
ncbi:MAG: hypothetical protein K2P88_16090 [Chitinophagaceae bacterium]|uniref:hypothetical protein n=1 Tax=unclassified Paraflavitalea TaxID=2798305 RepID=UPI003D3544C6|nr:hypothetical protein [Chitinophagaceae bacterium]